MPHVFKSYIGFTKPGLLVTRFLLVCHDGLLTWIGRMQSTIVANIIFPNPFPITKMATWSCSVLEIMERSSLVIDPWLHDPMPDYD